MFRILTDLRILALATVFICAGCTVTENSSGFSGSVVTESAVADTVYLNGKVYTGDTDRPWATAVAIRDGVFIAIGTDESVEQFVGPNTKRVNLAGKMAMPAIYDAHVHPVDSALQQLFDCRFPPTLGLTEIVAEVEKCSVEDDGSGWIRGGQWGSEFMASETPPHKGLLDAKIANRPVLLMDISVHSAWVNSAALTELGIDKDTPDPKGGIIVRDEAGEPTGLLLEAAAYKALAKLPARSIDQYDQAVKWSIDELNKYGVVGAKDAFTDRHILDAYLRADKRGSLNARLATSLTWKGEGTAFSHDQQRQLIRDHARYRTPRVDTRFAKIMVDGIPLGKTAAMLDPYAPSENHGKGFRGELRIDAETLKRDVTMLDKMGISVLMHSAGDRATRIALDAIQAARKANGSLPTRHQVAHTSYIHPNDFSRYRKLGAVAGYSPVFWFPSPVTPAFEAELGAQRGRKIYPIRSLTEEGALGVYGSDWPVTPIPNPWPAMEGMITRKDPSGTFSGQLWPAQAIDLKSAIQIFTANGAKAMRLGDVSGTIEAGKSADMIVLDRNLFEISPDNIGETQVLLTLLAGNAVHASGEFVTKAITN